MSSPKRVVLAYSGGLDTSVILRWLIERYRCEVVAFCADLGQGEELIPIREKALRTGASAVHVVDLRERFVRDFIFPMLRANAVYEGAYLLGTSIARPLIAAAQVELAATEGADTVAHGATGKGNDQVRFELTYAALAPYLRVIAPWREWELTSRSALIEFAKRYDIPVPVTPERPYSTDRNLFHCSTKAGCSRTRGPSRRRRCSSSPRIPRRRPTWACPSRSISSGATRWRWAASGSAPSRCSPASTVWAASTGSGASTSSRIGSSE